jgi:predicted transglutaminase-like cysteine proteinase
MNPAAKISLFLTISGLIATASGCATTTTVQQPKPQASASSQLIPEKRRSVEPFAHVMFCTRTPAECANSTGPDIVQLTADRKSQLASVNQSVNSQIFPRNDNKLDVWSLSPQSGDCEDYAITKRHRLIQNGWPASALRLALGYTDAGEGHLVLIARTSEGDLVLDNLTNTVRDWRQAGIRLQTIQSANPRIWHKV